VDKKPILLTIDLEDWFQVENFKNYIDQSDWKNLEWRFERNTHTLLDLFDQNQIKATFFVLGWNAEHVPQLIKEIYRRGHEVASHGYMHDLCSIVDEVALRNDLRKSKQILEDITGVEVKGYRAPSFSISDDVIHLLKETGYQYDSSYDCSSLNPRHGTIDLAGFMQKGIAYMDSGGFSEIPISNLQIANTTLPWGGGGYFRFWPRSLFQLGVRKILSEQEGYVFYTHPWEFDPGQPRVNQAAPLSRFRHYLNLESSLNKFTSFIKSFDGMEFLTCQKYIDNLKCGR